MIIHVICTWSVTWYVCDQPPDQCVMSHVISAGLEIESFPLSDGEGIQLTSLWVLLVIFTCVVFLLVPLYVEVMCIILLCSFWFCLLYILSLVSSQSKMRWVAPLHSTLLASCSWLLPAGASPLQRLVLHAHSVLQLKLGLMFWS